MLGETTATFSMLAILVASLGLFGLVAFSVEQRRKEIGVRRVLGASVAGVVGLFSTEFLKLVGVANLIARPAAYLLMNGWLQSYAYRVDLGIATYLAASIAVLGLALATVSTQAINAARGNPVDALRFEQPWMIRSVGRPLNVSVPKDGPAAYEKRWRPDPSSAPDDNIPCLR